MNGFILSVRNLNVILGRADSELKIVKNATFDLRRGSTLGLIGESGSGKSILCKSLIRLIPPNGRISGSIILNFTDREPIDINSVNHNDLLPIRGKAIGFLPQEPMVSMNPVIRCGKQVSDALPYSIRSNKSLGKNRAISLLEMTGLRNPELAAKSYPHELSGGMLQRVALAAALAGEPSILIADEPVTALDVSSRIGIMKTLSRLKEEMNLSIILVSHDLDFVSRWVDDLMVMYLGNIVETGSASSLLTSPSHPYTKALLDVSKSYREDKKPIVIPGEIPSIESVISGCKFHPRCEYADEICSKDDPQVVSAHHGGSLSCHHPIIKS